MFTNPFESLETRALFSATADIAPMQDPKGAEEPVQNVDLYGVTSSNSNGQRPKTNLPIKNDTVS